MSFIRKIIPLLLVLASCRPSEKPLIGISCCLDDGRSHISAAYFDAVLAAGGVPVAVPCGDEGMVREIDALILIGGEDVDPARYGEKPVGDCVEINAPRDTADFALVSAAIKEGLPVLAICRGMQLLNIALGGTLVQDIPTQVEAPLSHSGHREEKVHVVNIAGDSRIAGIVGADTLAVNSTHHQAVRLPGRGLRITGTTSDGVVEMYESLPGSGMDIIGIQSHPEVFARLGEQPYLSIYKDLVNRARAR